MPIAVKLSPFYSSLAMWPSGWRDEGADGLVLFNRFYQPDLDIEELEVVRSLRLSQSSELLMRLRWLAILSSILPIDLAVSEGFTWRGTRSRRSWPGPSAVQMVSSLLRHGPDYLAHPQGRGDHLAWEEHDTSRWRRPGDR